MLFKKEMMRRGSAESYEGGPRAALDSRTVMIIQWMLNVEKALCCMGAALEKECPGANYRLPVGSRSANVPSSCCIDFAKLP